MSDTQNASASDSTVSGEPIVAGKRWRYHRLKMLLMCAALAVGGCWFLYDGFVAWPAANRAHTGPKVLHDDFDIQLQKLLGFVLLPAGLLLVGYRLRVGRGEYRLEGQTLHIPGHEPIGLESITRINRAKWERKGIADIDYTAAGGATRTFRLDCLMFDEEACEAIMARLASLAGDEGDESGEAEDEGDGD